MIGPVSQLKIGNKIVRIQLFNLCRDLGMTLYHLLPHIKLLSKTVWLIMLNVDALQGFFVYLNQAQITWCRPIILKWQSHRV